MDLNTLFLETARRLPDKEVLFWKYRRFTFREIEDAARRLAGGLVERGIRPGDRVGVLLPNSPETIFAHLGIQLAGAIRVPVNAAYTAREARHVVETTACALTITDQARWSLAEEAMSGGAKPLSPPAPIDTVADSRMPRHGAVRLSGRAATPGGGAARPCLVADLLGAIPLGNPPAPSAPDAVSLICFTSGTSGKPKGVRLTHGNLASNILALVNVWEWTERDVLYLCLPLMHVHGLGNGLNGWIATGCTLVLEEKFDAAAALDGLERHHATMFFGVPAMYHKILELSLKARRDLRGMRLWVCGSAPLDRGLADRFEEVFGHRICNRYGMTETAMITANPSGGERRAGSVGRALPGMDVWVVDPATGSERPIGETGEIAVRGPSLSPGYWNDEKDDATRLVDGYFRTGDLGWKDADGYFFITGRAKDIIISGGTNIAPLEIEEVLLQHPAVGEAVVLGIPDPALGEVLRAVVVPKQGRGVTLDEISTWCSTRLAKFKRPKQVLIVSTPLPRNAMQKLDRNQARTLYGGA